MSLQRRRECYVIMHMWKILHGLTSNDLQVQFTVNARLRNLAKVPSFRKKISAAHQTLYKHHSVLWALSCGTVYLPKYVQSPNMIASSVKWGRSCFLCRTNRQFGASPNSNFILDLRNDWEASALWGGQQLWWTVKFRRSGSKVRYIS